MSTDNKLKEIKLRLQLIMLLRKLNKIYAHDKAISSDEPKWITVHPHGKGAINKNGEDIKGTPVLLESETGEVLGGMGGKYNGVHISEACSKENTLNTQHDIKRGQMMRENPQKFAAEQKAREQKAQQHLKDLQDTAKKETAKEQQKAKAKQPETSANSVDYSLLDTDVKDILKGFDLSNTMGIAPHFVNDAATRQEHTLCEAAVKGKNWETARGVSFANKELNKKFLNLEHQVYKFKAAQHIAADKGEYLPTEMAKAGAKITEQYETLCKQWAKQEAPKVEKKLIKVEADIKAFCKSLNIDRLPSPMAGNFSLYGSYYVKDVGSVAREVMTKLSGTLDNSASSYVDNSQAKYAPRYFEAYGKAKEWAQQLKYLEDRALTDDQAKLLQNIQKQCDQLLTKSKAVILAKNNAYTMKSASFHEASRKYFEDNAAQHSFAMNPPQIAGVTKSKPMDFEKANNKAANPHYDADVFIDVTRPRYENLNRPYRINCQTCVVAYEMRRRGYDVEAQPNWGDDRNGCDKLSTSCLAAWRNPKTGGMPEPHQFKSLTQVAHAVKPGERHFLLYSHESGGGHIVTLGCDNTGPFVYDPQTGARSSVQSYAERYSSSTHNYITYRVDDCELDSNVANSVLVKSNQGPIKN